MDAPEPKNKIFTRDEIQDALTRTEMKLSALVGADLTEAHSEDELKKAILDAAKAASATIRDSSMSGGDIVRRLVSYVNKKLPEIDSDAEFARKQLLKPDLQEHLRKAFELQANGILQKNNLSLAVHNLTDALGLKGLYQAASKEHGSAAIRMF